MESVQFKDKNFSLSLRPGWVTPGVSSMDTIGKNKKSTKLKQGLLAVPTGKSRTGIPEGPGTLPP